MSQPREQSLHELLRRVRERLSRAQKVDAESRRLLSDLMQDIERKLGAGSARAGVHGESVPRLEELAVRFETEHPALGQGLRQLIDLLSKGGI